MGSSSEVVRTVGCRCCGMQEECTPGYIKWVEERFGGKWLCGLCEEAVKDEQARLGVTVEAALSAHASFRGVAATDQTIRAAHSFLRLLKKSMSSPSNATSSSP